VTYRLAESLDVLRAEVNAMAPMRSKASDGWIGDAAHADRTSDHNPFIIDVNGVGVVRAFDFTHDPAHGCDADVLAERIRILGKAGDRRLDNGGYVIRNRRIASAKGGWAWRPYDGTNPHTKHVHISVSTIQRDYDNRAGWLQEDDVQLTDKITVPATYESAKATGQTEVTVEVQLARIGEWAFLARRDAGLALATAKAGRPLTADETKDAVAAVFTEKVLKVDINVNEPGA
jgi:hypothetical protein